ncbi:hypothetical protein [Streptomyces dubilierae]|uniref:Uncharacterized protein n=1 Tax=Streptomyces dubilierae TaxID=3075533 RepID=A0ABU2P987_9ACTN|nr:hypothetical protein [Streptomyces sp. DSM 41921]MDT0387860.1 hypothetical protein [Streptomyces sp. DSM 41921]
MTDQTDADFVPPAAAGLPAGTLEAAEIGANRLDAWARTPQGRNFLAHALVQLARTGWLRTEPSDGFEPMSGQEPAQPAAVEPPVDRAAAPMTDERAAALLAPLKAKARELRAQKDAQLRDAAFAEAAAVADRIADEAREKRFAEGQGKGSTALGARLVAEKLRRMAGETPAATEAQPAQPDETRWHILTHQRGTWRPWLAPRHDHTEAREDYDQCVTSNGHRWAFRLVRETSTYAVEAEHTPEQP